MVDTEKSSKIKPYCYGSVEKQYSSNMLQQYDDESDYSESNEGNTFELWTDETIEIETPFSQAPDDVEHLRLEVIELKQIILTLAEKYKLSEDKRKVAERRNAFLKSDNHRLQELSEVSLKQKCEALIDLELTLNKMREFISYKNEFERKAQLLQMIISRLPKMKNASTSMDILYEEAVEDMGEEATLNHLPKGQEESYSEIRSVTDGSFEVVEAGRLEEEVQVSDWTHDGLNEKSEVTKDNQVEVFVDAKYPADPSEDVQNEESYLLKDRKRKKLNDRNIYKHKKIDATGDCCREGASSKVLIKLNKLKQEVLSLKNLNDWKTNDLDFKKQELALKTRELDQANKDIFNLKTVISKLQSDRARRCTNQSAFLQNLVEKP